MMRSMEAFFWKYEKVISSFEMDFQGFERPSLSECNSYFYMQLLSQKLRRARETIKQINENYIFKIVTYSKHKKLTSRNKNIFCFFDCSQSAVNFIQKNNNKHKTKSSQWNWKTMRALSETMYYTHFFPLKKNHCSW